jgi:serine/threonine protein kinase
MVCTGRVPFRAETSFGVLRRISDDLPRPIRELNPEIPEWLVTIVERLHAKNPAERFASASDVSQLCEQCLAHIQQPTAIPLPESLKRHPTKLPVSQRTWSTAIAAALLCGIAIVLCVLLWPSPPPARESSDDLDEQGSAPIADLNEPAAEAGQQAVRFRWDDGFDQPLSQLKSAFLRAEQQIAPRSDDLRDTSLNHFSADPLRAFEWEPTP